MTEPNEQYAYFTVVDSFDPEEITSFVGMKPTECWKKGEINPRTQFERKFSRWCLHSRLDKKLELEAHIRDVLLQLDENPLAFQKISQMYEGCMQLDISNK